MLKLYYTTTTGYNNPQDKIVNSIGGYKSATAIPNDVMENLFDGISLQMMAQPKPQYVAIVLVNEGTEVASNVEMWFDPDPNTVNYCTFQIGAVVMVPNTAGEMMMEQVDNTYCRPFQTELHDATVEDKVSIGDMQPGDMIGLWLSRIPQKTVMWEDYNNVAEKDDTTVNRYKSIVKDTEETISFQITWE